MTGTKSGTVSIKIRRRNKMQLTITYDSTSSPSYEMEKKLEKILEEYDWECVGSGYFIDGDTKVGERDIEYRKEK
tara:strand:- start:1229 stop:1453 length:225 start_codon:yes stop_codon:yes gene_type:complete